MCLCVCMELRCCHVFVWHCFVSVVCVVLFGSFFAVRMGLCGCVFVCLCVFKVLSVLLLFAVALKCFLCACVVVSWYVCWLCAE